MFELSPCVGDPTEVRAFEAVTARRAAQAETTAAIIEAMLAAILRVSVVMTRLPGAAFLTAACPPHHPRQDRSSQDFQDEGMGFS